MIPCMNQFVRTLVAVTMLVVPLVGLLFIAL